MRQCIGTTLQMVALRAHFRLGSYTTPHSSQGGLPLFTGIIQHQGTVLTADPSSAGARLRVSYGGWRHRPALGASIALNGCCLSVVEVSDEALVFDVVPATLARTTLGTLGRGNGVNLEHAARADALLDGHIVQGHVDGVGTVHAVDQLDGYCVTIHAPSCVAMHLAPRGSITVDGVSLTIAKVHEDTFDVALIPTTLAETTLGSLAVGDQVNLEADILGKLVAQHVERLLTQREA